jgi:hypothetical protein
VGGVEERTIIWDIPRPDGGDPNKPAWLPLLIKVWPPGGCTIALLRRKSGWGQARLR